MINGEFGTIEDFLFFMTSIIQSTKILITVDRLAGGNREVSKRVLSLESLSGTSDLRPSRSKTAIYDESVVRGEYTLSFTRASIERT